MLTTVDVIIISLFGGFCVLDAFIPARHFPSIRGWRIKGVFSAIVYFGLATYAPFLWDGLLAPYQLIDVSALGFWSSVAIGFLAYQFAIFAWHRTLHAVPFLWRHFHQMHHSAERVDIYGALYFHPLDTIGFAFVGSLALVAGIGVTPEATVVIVIASSFCGLFQHANIKTPRWLGLFITRPESHSVHHQRGLHGYNYGDIPLFDMLFGSFRNPKTWQAEAGFYDGASHQIWALLIGRDLSAERREDNKKSGVSAPDGNKPKPQGVSLEIPR